MRSEYWYVEVRDGLYCVNPTGFMLCMFLELEPEGSQSSNLRVRRVGCTDPQRYSLEWLVCVMRVGPVMLETLLVLLDQFEIADRVCCSVNALEGLAPG